MDRKALDQMRGDLKGVKRVPRSFGFAPNQDSPVLVISKTTPVMKASFASVVEGRLGVPFQGKAIYIGQIVKTDTSWHLAVDPGASQGQISEAKARIGLRKLADLLKVGALKKATLSFGASEDRPQAAEDFAALDTDPLRIAQLLARQDDLSDAEQDTLRDQMEPLKALRDGIKLNLKMYEALAPKQQEVHRQRQASWQVLLEEIQALRERAKVVLARQPEMAPRQTPVLSAALPLQSGTVRGFSKRAGRQLARYEQWVQSMAQEAGGRLPPEAHRTQILAIKEAALQSRRDAQGSPDKVAALEGLLRSLDEKLLEITVQEKIDQGYLRTTADNDASGGASGSYFIGDEDHPRQHVFKPMYQEYQVNSGDAFNIRRVGSGAVGEVLASRLRDRLQEQTGLALPLQKVSLVTLETEKFGQVGAGMKEDAQKQLGYDVQNVVKTRQPGALIDGIPGVRGDVGDWFRHSHPNHPQITIKARDLENFEKREAALSALEGWAELTEEQKTAHHNHLLGAPMVCEVPEVLRTSPEMVKQVSQIAITCALTGQMDYRNSDNLLITGPEDAPQLNPIDFGISNPNVDFFLGNFDSRSASDPWVAWSGTPWASQPMPPEICTALTALQEDELMMDVYQESVRIAQNIGQEGLSLSMEQVQIQRLMIKATRLLAQGTAQRNLPLTPLLLRDLFFSADPREQKSLFSTFVRALEAHRTENGPLNDITTYETLFAEKVVTPLGEWLDRLQQEATQ